MANALVPSPVLILRLRRNGLVDPYAGDIPSVDEAEIAWASGLFEGEGCFTIQRHRAGFVGIIAQLKMVDEDVVRHFGAVMGEGRVYLERRQRGRDLYVWRVHGQMAERAYAKMEPWLHQRRRTRYAELIAERREYEERLPAIRSERTARGRATRFQPGNQAASKRAA